MGDPLTTQPSTLNVKNKKKTPAYENSICTDEDTQQTLNNGGGKQHPLQKEVVMFKKVLRKSVMSSFEIHLKN